MQRVEAPQERHGVLTAMHGILQQVEQQESRHKARPLISDWPGGQSHAKCRLKLRLEGVPRRESEAGEDNIQEPDAEIAEPPLQRRKLATPPWPAEFPQGGGEQAAKEHNEGQRYLLTRIPGA
jgi:hypothetical protein